MGREYIKPELYTHYRLDELIGYIVHNGIDHKFSKSTSTTLMMPKSVHSGVLNKE